MIQLPPGANRPLPRGPVSAVLPGPFDLSAVVVGENGKVASDGDLVFYNQPSAPGVTLRTKTVTIEPGRLRFGAVRVVLVASPETQGATFGRLPPPVVDVRDSQGAPLAQVSATRLSSETALLCAEIYRRGEQWKLRALGSGYADGLAGLVRDFGVKVDDDGSGDRHGGRSGHAEGRRDERGGARGDGRGASARRGTAGPAVPRPGSATPAVPTPAAGWAPGGDVLAEVVRLTNIERSRARLGPLVAELRLAGAAQAHSEHMAVAGFFAHESPDGRQVWDRVEALGYRYAAVAENIAAGQNSAGEVVEGWMHSPGHRKNILNSDVTQIGVGHARGGEFGTYWTQVFGKPRTW